MPKYHVSRPRWEYVVVEAADEVEADEKAHQIEAWIPEADAEPCEVVEMPELVSQCCGKPAIPEIDISEYGATGLCSGCREWAMFEPEPGEEDES